MIDLKIVIIWAILGVSAVFAFTGNMFLGDYTRVFVAIGLVGVGVLLYTTEQKLPEQEAIDSQRLDLRNQLAATETIRTSPQPQSTPDIHEELKKIDTQFAEMHKEEHKEEVKVEEPPKPEPVTEISLAKKKQAELRAAKAKREADPFAKFKE